MDDIATEALLFQTGYLTITHALDLNGESLYQLGYPDREVRQSLNRSLFEFKVVEMSGVGAALGQLREKDYAAKYRGGEGAVFLVGVEFSRETRNVVGFEVG